MLRTANQCNRSARQITNHLWNHERVGTYQTRRFISTTTVSSSTAATTASSTSATTATPASYAFRPSPAPRKKQGKGVLLTLGALITIGFGFPFWYSYWSADIGNHYTGDKALTPNQVKRGAYLNTGSKDVGPDASWQQKHGIIPVEGKKENKQQQQ